MTSASVVSVSAFTGTAVVVVVHAFNNTQSLPFESITARAASTLRLTVC